MILDPPSSVEPHLPLVDAAWSVLDAANDLCDSPALDACRRVIFFPLQLPLAPTCFHRRLVAPPLGSRIWPAKTKTLGIVLAERLLCEGERRRRAALVHRLDFNIFEERGLEMLVYGDAAKTTKAPSLARTSLTTSYSG
jgi:hypothetical protein